MASRRGAFPTIVTLSRDKAAALCTDLAELAIHLQCVELKYGIPGDLEEGPNFRAVLSALRPFALEPKVAGIAQSAGFTLLNYSSEKPKLTGFIDDGSLERQISATTTDFEPTAGEHSRATTEESILPCTPSAEGVRKVLLLPLICIPPERWTHDFDHRMDAKVGEVRRELAKRMKIPLGKLRLLEQQAQGFVVLDDDAEALRASTVHVLNVATAASVQASTGSTPDLSKERALAMLGELRTGIDALSREPDVVNGLIKKFHRVQAKVLPKYGFSANASGVKSMLQAFDQLIGDEDVAKVGEAFNNKLGFSPQMYTIREIL